MSRCPAQVVPHISGHGKKFLVCPIFYTSKGICYDMAWYEIRHPMVWDKKRHGMSWGSRHDIGWLGFGGCSEWSPRANPNPAFPHSPPAIHARVACRGDVASPEIAVEGLLAKLAAIFPTSRLRAVVVLCWGGLGCVGLAWPRWRR